MERTEDLGGLLAGGDRVDPIEREQLILEVERGLFGAKASLRVGRYEILNRLGGGGQGVVHVAHDPRLDRRVAVKLLRAETVGLDARRRLLREANALARLSHPNVVSVNDVGECELGVFIVTELVPGTTLAEWLATRRPWPEVSRVFLEAAEGLIAAHARGLVHRDFKPANVLVGDDGRVRLLDFGLARSLGGAWGEGSSEDDGTPQASHAVTGRSRASGSMETITRTGHAMGTPAYMAPEQHAGEAADALADQFAFCVALYEALWGVRPFVARTVEELARAKHRGSIPAPRRRDGVPRALFRVVARGLAPDPRARFADMRALAAALRRASRPRARGTWLVMGLGVVAALGIVTGVSSWADSARPTTDVAQSLDAAGSTPEHAALRDAVAEGRALLERGRIDEAASVLERAYLEAEAARLPSISLQAARELARLHGAHRSDAPTGRDWLRRAEVALERAGRSSIDPIERGLLLLASAEITGRAGDHVAALDGARQAMEILAEELTDAHVHLVHARTHVARTLMYMNRLDEAQVEADRALADALAVSGPDHVDTAAVLNVLALVAKRRGDFASSLELQRRNLAIREAAGDPFDPIVPGVLGNIAVLLSELGQAAEAEATYRRALAIQRASPEGDESLVARTLHNLAITVRDRGRTDEALSLWREALSIGARTLGPDHSEVAAYEFMYAMTLSNEGRHDEALPLLRHALEVDRAALGDDHPTVAERLAGLGDAQLGLGDLEGARQSITEAVAIVEAAYGQEHPHTARIRVGLAILLKADGRIEESLAVYEQSLAVFETTLGSEHTALAELLMPIAEQLEALGRTREARDARARAAAIFAVAHGEAKTAD